jgi:hypothetical protein
MHDAADCARLGPGLIEYRAHAGDDPLLRVGVRGQHLGAPMPAAFVVVQHEIGEGAADIDAERIRGHLGSSGSLGWQDIWRQAHSRRGEWVELRRVNHVVAVAAEHASPVLVGQNEQRVAGSMTPEA